MTTTQTIMPADMVDAAKRMFEVYKSNGSASQYAVTVEAFQPLEIALRLFGKMIAVDRTELTADEINEKFTLCYFDQVFDGKPESYWGIEIQGCVELLEKDGSTFIDVDNTSPSFFAVYLRGKECRGLPGLHCIADFDLYAKALGYAQELTGKYGWNISDHVVTKVAVAQ